MPVDWRLIAAGVSLLLASGLLFRVVPVDPRVPLSLFSAAGVGLCAGMVRATR